MGTLDVVGIDFEHGLRVHPCLLGSCQVLVGHLRCGLLSTVLYQYPSGKGTGSLVVEHILVEFVRGAVGYPMGDKRIVVHMLLLVGDDATITMTFGTFAREGQVKLIAGDAIVQRDDVMRDATVGLLVDIDIADAHVLVVCLFQAVEV